MTEPASMPLISVIMAVRNSESMVGAAIDSVLRQSYTNWEFIICDDASTDGTAGILAEIAGANPEARITVLRNKDNRKLAYSLNRCLEVASGEFIARMDADDVSEPDRFARQMEFLLANPDVDLVGTAMRRFNDDGPGDVVPPVSTRPERDFMARTTKAPFFHATIIARRGVFERVGNYTVSWRTERGQDLDLWFKFFAEGFVGVNLAEPLYLVREDGAAIRRRTVKVRLGVLATRWKGSRALGYPLHAYLYMSVDLAKMLVPYQVFEWHRARLRKQYLEGAAVQGGPQ